MARFNGFRLRMAKMPQGSSGADVLSTSDGDDSARDRMIEKIRSMGEGFSKMSEREYDDWINALPRNEFVELATFCCDNKQSA